MEDLGIYGPSHLKEDSISFEQKKWAWANEWEQDGIWVAQELLIKIQAYTT